MIQYQNRYYCLQTFCIYIIQFVMKASKQNQKIIQSYQFPGQLAMIDCDSTYQYFAVGGREHLKIIQINFNSSDDYIFNHKGSIKQRGSQQSNMAKPAVNDLSWNKLAKQKIAIGSTAGTVSIYDTTQSQLQFRSENIYFKKQHESHVSKIEWSPHQATLLISASLESGVKVWDIRTKDSQLNVNIKQMIFESEKKIRDLKFSPHNQNLIAVGYQSGGLAGGGLQIFDIRKIRTDKSQTNTKYQSNSVMFQLAHSQTVNSIDWNPTQRNILATGSLDKQIKIWDTNGNKFIETQKILHVSSISMIKWRSKPNTLLGACSLNVDRQIYFYDVRHKYRPYSIYKGHTDIVKCFLFGKDQQYLISGAPILNSQRSLIVAQHIDNYILPYETCPRFPVVIDPFNNLVFSSQQASDITKFENPIQREIIIIKNSVSINKKNMNLGQEIRYLHKNYITKGGIQEISRVNSEVALELGKKSCANLWMNIFTIAFPQQDLVHTIQSIYEEKIQIHGGISLSDDRIIINDKSKLKKQIKKISVEPFIQNIIDEGELQTAVIMIICLRNINKNILSDTFVHNTIQPFIDLLRKYQLYTIASRIILDSRVEALSNTTNKHTEMRIGCGNCKKDLKQPTINCQSCKMNLNPLCIRCQEPLDHLLVWCQYCGHGGHAKCYKNWFKNKNQDCPYSCGHKCFNFK